MIYFESVKAQYQLDCVNCKDKNNVQWSAVECDITCKKDKKGTNQITLFYHDHLYSITNFRCGIFSILV